MNFKRISAMALVVATLGLAACGTNPAVQVEYYKYLQEEAKAKSAVGVAEAQAKQARYTSSALIANNADSTAKAAIGVAQAVNEGRDAEASAKSTSNPAQGIRPPETSEQVAYRWASLITGNVLPTWVQDRNGSRGKDVAIVQSNNAAQVQMNTNSTFLGLGLGRDAFNAPQPVDFYTDNLRINRPEPQN